MSTNLILPSDITEITELLGPLASQFAGKKILITGGRGFLGRYFVSVFSALNKISIDNPAEVFVMDNLITAGKQGAENFSDAPNIKAIEKDVIQGIPDLGHIDFVIHAAGIASPFYYRKYPLETLDVAITGTRHALEYATKKRARMIFFSSSEIYGDPDASHVPTPESYRGNVSCLGPRACYDESKRVGETLCRIYQDQFGTQVSMIRPFNVYGPGMQESDYRVLPNFASRLASKKALKVYGTGNQTRTFCYITDAINGFLRVLLSGIPGDPYNIGNPSPELSMHALAEMLMSLSKRPTSIDVIEYPDSYPADEPNRRCPDISKAHLQLGYSPVVSLEAGLTRFLRWSEENYVGHA